uniref:Uncharacterized protein n=1 Tax=Gasterosteus aculeatus TaxID=69293 RepID=G3PH68_GASAC
MNQDNAFIHTHVCTHHIYKHIWHVHMHVCIQEERGVHRICTKERGDVHQSRKIHMALYRSMYLSLYRQRYRSMYLSLYIDRDYRSMYLSLYRQRL